MHVHSLASFWCRQYPQMEIITIVFPKDINPPGFTNSFSLSLTRNCFPALGNYLCSCIKITKKKKKHILTLSTCSLHNYIPHLSYSLSIAFKLGLLDQMHIT